MNRSVTALVLLAALALAGCATTTPEPAAAPKSQQAPTVDVPEYEPVMEPDITVDTTATSAHTFPDGLTITYNGTTVATPEQVATMRDDAEPVTISFTYTSTAPGPIPLQPVPFSVQYGANMFDAEQPTLFQGDTTHTELPAQITPGTSVDVVDTYWVPAGEPITVTVDVSGLDDQVRPAAVFTNITAR